MPSQQNAKAVRDLKDRDILELFRSAEEVASADAQYELGMAFFNGNGVPKDDSKAIHWFQKSAEQGHGLAQFQLGSAYELGQGIPKDFRKAAECYLLAAGQSISAACARLGIAYQLGQGVQQDSKVALTWLHTGADLGDMNCQCGLGDAYRVGRGAGLDQEKSVEWYRRAADQGNQSAQYRLAKAYHYGNGALKDLSAALEWYEKAANQGNAEAGGAARKLSERGIRTPVLPTRAEGNVSSTSCQPSALASADSPQKILIDTSVLLVDPEVIVRVIAKKGLPFITNTILLELDYNKKTEGLTGYNARKIFRTFSTENMVKHGEMPGGQPLVNGDSLRQFIFENSPIYVLVRDKHNSRNNNDSKIIEVGKDYGMFIITRDEALQFRAESEGVKAIVWKPPEVVKKLDRAPGPAPVEKPDSGPLPFATPTAAITEKDSPLRISSLPATGGTVTTLKNGSIHLRKALSAGGEGTIYETDRPGLVCKIYHKERLTVLRQRKVELMLTRHVEAKGICWPVDVALNDDKEFVGYLMPKASGRTIQTTMFIKPVLEKNFPTWTRLDLVNLCIAFLDQITYLHRLNIIVGDINPLNLLVDQDSTRMWLVDTDSFQIEAFPCQVGTVNFTAPEIQGVNYSEFLRTKENELFAVATMLFMLLHPGKPPYAQQGGGNPADNIRAMDFSYPFGGTSNGKAPQGPWQNIWGNLTKGLKEAFWKTFKENRRVEIDEWQKLMKSYQWAITKGHNSDEMFPTTFKIHDPIDVVCGECANTVTASKKRVEKMASEGKAYCCGSCVDKFRLNKLVHDSQRIHRESIRKATPQRQTNYRPSHSPRPSPYNTPKPNSPSFLDLIFNFFK